ncbi:nudix domain-containing protein [Biscogniauxia marginata]|nr:nudix domain-containing protein [Biscogniauxia marginata]
MATVSPHPRVGVAALIRNAKGEFIMGKRKGSHGVGTWQFPGGHLEMGESLLACAERETLEETGLKVTGVKVVTITNDVFDNEKHYITIFVDCVMQDIYAKPEVLEPDKCESWHWVSWEEVRRMCDEKSDRSPFLPIRNLVRDHHKLDLSG